MNKLKRYFCISVISLLVLISFVSAERVFVLQFELDKEDNVEFNNFFIHEGASGGSIESSYNIKVFSGDNILYKKSFLVDFEIENIGFIEDMPEGVIAVNPLNDSEKVTIAQDSEELDVFFVSINFPVLSNITKISINKLDDILYELDPKQYLCKKVKDGVCDSNCVMVTEADPDCDFEDDSSKKEIEDKIDKKIKYLIYFIIGLVIIFVIIGILRNKKSEQPENNY